MRYNILITTYKGGKNMEAKRQPIGIELVRRGLITENDIKKALENGGHFKYIASLQFIYTY